MSALDAIAVAATLAAWRARGAQQLDPVRFHTLEALARRAGGHAGTARRVLDAKLVERLNAYDELMAAGAAGAATQAAAEVPVNAPQQQSALAQLVERFEPRASSSADDALGYLRTTWSRLSAQKRLVQSLAAVPGNAGPLNSHHLAQRALTVMHDLSPGYLGHFMAYVDALLWLDQANGGHAFAGTAAGPDKAPAPAKAVKRRSPPAPR